MKKFTGILIAALLVLAPLSASALEALTDSALSDVTGQAGVDIALDDVAILIESLQDTTYTDTDTGLGVMIDYEDNTNKLILLDGIYDETDDGQVLNYNVAAIDNIFSQNAHFVANRAGNVGIGTLSEQAVAQNAGQSFVMRPTPLRIDIGKCEVLSAARDYYMEVGGTDTYYVGGVIIGLPTVTIEIYSDMDTKRIKLAYDANLDDSSARYDELLNNAGAAGSTYGDLVGAACVAANPAANAAEIQTLVDTEIASKASSGAACLQTATDISGIPMSREAAGMSEFIAITKSGYAKYAILGGTLEIAPH